MPAYSPKVWWELRDFEILAKNWMFWRRLLIRNWGSTGQIWAKFEILSIVCDILLHSCPLGPFLRALMKLVEMGPALGTHPG